MATKDSSLCPCPKGTSEPPAAESTGDLPKILVTQPSAPVASEPSEAVPAPAVDVNSFDDAEWADFSARVKKFDGLFPQRVENHISRFPKEEVQRFARDSHAILWEPTAHLAKKFLDIKKEHGTDEEKSIYHSMSLVEFVDRLLLKRPLMFMAANDTFILRDGATEGAGGFEAEARDPRLPLAEYLSYDEMQVSALLGVSSHVHFINDGSRSNHGKAAPPGTYEPTGIYAGLVGARFERTELMEWQHLLVTEAQNIPEKGYGRSRAVNPLLDAWAHFYKQPVDDNNVSYFPSHAELAALTPQELEATGYRRLNEYRTDFFNERAYRRRIRAVVLPFLQDANIRAKDSGKKAFVHVVGLGLGVWELSRNQAKLFVGAVKEIFEKRISVPHITHVDFSYFPSDLAHEEGVVENANLHNHVKVTFSKRNPAEPLNDPSLLLCAMYAWDSNSFPGNEYWAGMLSASGDPAAVACSTLSVIQNPYINTFISGKTAVQFNATESFGL